MSSGLPITVAFRMGGAKEAEAELREGGSKGPAVAVLVSAPDKPANAQIPDNKGCIAILPRSALRGRAVYWVRVSTCTKESVAS